MSSSGAIMGHGGKAVVDAVLLARMTQWSLDVSASESAWGDSDSAGYTNRAAARKDATGSLQGKFDSNQRFYSLMAEGDTIELQLWEDADASSPSKYWHFPRVLVQSFNLVFDQDSKEVVGWTANFGADGIYYRPGQSGAPAKSLPS